ncbi:hypothetical protein D9611_000075 [Ephemerocybe angulata]|uniref:HAD-superfamily hydrolase n=1 Tax=Ephemerocybe angulata TaxID=980116 RepID=A0A8H5BMA4_9AGAR|nr:hypothetical protein D9611_000075 [Tulosesus angulatus]
MSKALRVLSPRHNKPSMPFLKTRYLQTTASGRKAPPLAFVFDIDGVLIRGAQVLPEAKKALNILAGENPFRTKIPFLLLTNGGGVSEEARCKSLSAKLGVEIEHSQYIQSHTILKKHARRFADEPILVLGGKLDTVRRVAEGYGFKRVYTTLDVLAWNPSTWPFHQLTEAEKESTKAADFSKLPISAVFVFHDPRNWALDVQILSDILQSGGIIGGPWVPVEKQQKPVEVTFCNPDLLWGSDFPRPRIGQGGFKEAFQAAITGKQYPYVQYGKPTKATYDFTKEVLEQRFNEEYGSSSKPSSLYMIGDNPESDIAGANAAQWNSVLVKTGVYNPEQGPPAHAPTHTANDVLEAVQWAVEREYSKHAHSQ